MGTARAAGTAARILDIAERLVQSRGYNAFSYADVAHAVGIRKASLHYHFATKADLGQALVARYRRAFLEALQGIEAREAAAPGRLRDYVALYGAVLRRKRMCMCGMLATDAARLMAVVVLPTPPFWLATATIRVMAVAVARSSDESLPSRTIPGWPYPAQKTWYW